MKIPKMKIAMIMGFIAIASASVAGQTGEFGGFAESDSVTTFNTTTDEVAFEFSNISDEDVYVELLNDGEVVHTTDVLSVDSSGFVAYDAEETVDVDKVAVYPQDSEPSAVESVDLLYDYSGTAVDDPANYSGTQTFSSFTVTEDSQALLNYLVPLLLVLAVVGFMADL